MIDAKALKVEEATSVLNLLHSNQRILMKVMMNLSWNSSNIDEFKEFLDDEVDDMKIFSIMMTTWN